VKTDSQSQHLRLAVLRGTYRYMPAVLLEVGFLTNKHDVELLRNSNWREETAIALADAITGT
jgi:N-acetylmuramoyl-L-alanine amidase